MNKVKCPICGDTRIHNVYNYWWECSHCGYEMSNKEYKTKKEALKMYDFIEKNLDNAITIKVEKVDGVLKYFKNLIRDME